MGTEARFAFRKWLQTWIDQFRTRPKESHNLALADEFMAIGFATKDLSAENFGSFIATLTEPDKRLTVRMPAVSVSYDHFLYSVNGDMEIFIDGILCFAGGVDCKLRAADESFEFLRMKFYPRMSMRVEI